ncbi:MAG: phosphatase PAP2 family protein [Roseibium sp.]|uniref:phosphatase PAP2 family protein n=1 Tax=Roseibium sp. TaxID=1936156 RepID=UPI00261561D3|nr:phosphatase PAP2 family protein [Roseibium sp.]MCV0425222.1 phosphatase PAP2 family protein [Roseibium sp.]
MKRLTGTLTAIAIIVAAATTSAQAASSTATLLPENAVEAQSKISTPPALGTPKFHEEMSTVLWLQETRTPEQSEFAETTLNVERFAPVVGEAMFEVNGPAMKALIDGAINEVRTDYDAVKAVYDYPRPFEINAAVEPLGDARPVASYPSGHSIRAVVYARLLAEVFPEKTDELMDLANRIGHGRVIAGVHYPMDVTSGQVLGHAYADAILAGPAFQQAVEDIRPGNAS